MSACSFNKVATVLVCLLWALVVGCGEDAGVSLSESERLVGQWLIEDPVAPTSARFSGDGTYRIEQDFGSTPFVQEGTWSLPEAHVLVTVHGEPAMRSTESVFVGQDELVIGGVLARVESTGPELEGVWRSVRAVEQGRDDGSFVVSSRVTREITFRAGGSGSMVSTTERDDPVTGEAQAPTTSTDGVSWQAGQGQVFTLSGALTGEFTLRGDQLVPLQNAYRRQ
mgnify:CR=1 FL=1